MSRRRRYPPHVELEELDRDELRRPDRGRRPATRRRIEARERACSPRCATPTGRRRRQPRRGHGAPIRAPPLCWRSSSATSSFVCSAAIRSLSGPTPASIISSGALGVDVAGEPLRQHLDLLGDQRLERPLVAQRVVDGEPDPLVVAAGAEAADRLDDPDVRGRVAALVGAQHPELGEPVEHLLRHVVALAHLARRRPARARRRARARGSGPPARSSRAGARARASSRSSSSRITRSGMKRSSWSCLITRIRSTNSGG